MHAVGRSFQSEFPRQKEAIEQYAAANGMEVVQYFDDALPGKTPLENRPGTEALMATLLSNEIQTVLIEKLDRLARDTVISETAVAYFQRNDFELISTMEPDLCSTEPTRVLYRTMMAAFSQYEKSMIVLKLKAARESQGEGPYMERRKKKVRASSRGS